ncbi:hypothetical protein K466DRAFT_180834 [Polyporus arcularius HHB13444]|uniref:C2H2-type domain-containing protein n=1 Tax=Polyporus arcularius HHB13444 TaxID=1314778 RepID=A0A5C3P8Q8_9APHY|nr:hypothetical protein K466DRAFT_180834 [Polyporus arcularius HHB13444]
MLEVPQVDAPGLLGPWRVPRPAKRRRFNAAPKANKRYHCPWCEEAMDRKSNLNVHIWEQHDPNFVPSQCPHCPKSYTRSNALKAHIRRNMRTFTHLMAPVLRAPPTEFVVIQGAVYVAFAHDV